jgi:hypothetical protein
MPQYIKINITDFAGTDTIPFNIYSKSKDRNEAVLFLRAGVKIPEERLLALADNENLTFFLEMSDLQAYREYFADKLAMRDITEFVDLPAASVGPAGGAAPSDPLEYVRLKNLFWGAVFMSLAEVYIGIPLTAAIIIAGVAAYFVFAATAIKTAGHFKNKEKNAAIISAPIIESKPAAQAASAPANPVPAPQAKGPVLQPSRAPQTPRSRMPAPAGGDKSAGVTPKMAGFKDPFTV